MPASNRSLEDCRIELLAVSISPIFGSGSAVFEHSAAGTMVCARCYNPSESVVAYMQIPAIEQELALCGRRLRELPKGFRIV